MKSNQLKKTTKNRKRVGRGEGSGQGRTAGRGNKGQKSRSGGNIPIGFEGGQNPLRKRIPKVGGFNRVNREQAQVVNLNRLESNFSANQTVSPQTLVKKGLIKDSQKPVKILGDGVLSKKLKFDKCLFSQSVAKKLGIEIAPRVKKTKKRKNIAKESKRGKKNRLNKQKNKQKNKQGKKQNKKQSKKNKKK
jgi:large subunit ribosomal protein L15